jgi:cobalt-zinc-cadmium efflux system protein
MQETPMHNDHKSHDHAEHGHSHAHGGHAHSQAHGGHGHSHAPTSFNRAFAIGVSLNVIFVITEVVYGLSAHSLALISDAGHNLSDVLGLLLAWGAISLGQSRPTARRTYGYRRSSILAALANAAMLLFVTGAVTWEAIRRFQDPQPIAATTIMWVAGIGIAINGITALMFFSGRAHDVNIRGAFMHMASDALIALGVVIAGFAIRVTGRLWIDPLVSIAIGLIITAGTWGLLKESLNLAMDAVPSHIDPGAVQTFLSALPRVSAVHDLHIWGMSTTETAMTVHLVTATAGLGDADLASICDVMKDRFSIGHCTIQIEHGDDAHPCAQEAASAV